MQGFKEGPIMFKPTFKYWNNTNNYNILYINIIYIKIIFN